MAHPKNTGRSSKKWRERVWTRNRRGGLRTIPAGKSRQRLLSLSDAGVGRKAVHEFTGLNHKTLLKIKNGRTKYVRRETASLIRSVPFNAHCDLALIDATETWERIERLTRWDIGFTKSEIARRLGAKRPAGYASLQIGRVRITARMAMQVEKIYRDAIGVTVATT